MSQAATTQMQMQVHNPTNSDDEALDTAISLSLYEAYHRKGKDMYGNMDANFARALQESAYLHLSSRESGGSQATSQATATSSSFCSGCNKYIGKSERHLSYLDKFWHLHCFRCHSCNKLITDHKNCSAWGNRPYHASCYQHLSIPKCDVCKANVPTNRSGLIEYQVHPFWNQRYCLKHGADGVPRCCSCERFESIDVKYISLDDGRKLCLECLSTSIMDSGECQPLYHEIRDFYEGLNMKINQQIPMLLVQTHALNEAKKGQHNNAETRGLCLSEEQTVRMIMRRPSLGPGNRMQNLQVGSTSLKRHCEVTAILVLYGLPRLSTGSVLAHELMHAWLRLNGFRNLEAKVEEGICQVLAHMWLESEVMAGTSNNRSYETSKRKASMRSTMEKKLGEFFLQQIANDPSPVYGKGFQQGYASMMRFGLSRTLEHIRMTGSFPL